MRWRQRRLKRDVGSSMQPQEPDPDALWRYYQRGYHCLVRSGVYFRRLLRPALSHVYFHRAVPLLEEYARVNSGQDEFPAGYREKLEACPLTLRDLLHLDYAICLGYAEAIAAERAPSEVLPILTWPGPPGDSAIFVSVDADTVSEPEEDLLGDLDAEDLEGMTDDDEEPKPPFDL